MKEKYDKTADAKYVSIKKGEVFETKAINDHVFYDVDASGALLGVEILGVSENDLAVAFDGQTLVISKEGGSTSEEVASISFEKN